MTTTDRHVLVIDDDAFFRAFSRVVLERAGFRCSEAETAVQGLAAALKDRPDLILLDYAMPTNDGLSVVEGLNAIDHKRSIPIIVLSAWKSDDAKARVRALGGTWLDKPIAATALVAAVQRRLNLSATA